MEIDLGALLRDTPQLVVFLVLGFGYLIGHLRIGPIELGPVAGVLLAALFFGHFELGGAAAATLNLGFIFFIYCVGLQAGPSFFSVVREGGLRYAALVAVCAASALLALGILARWLDLAPTLSAGILGGSLTSTPTLAAAQDAIKSGLVAVPRGESRGSLVEQVAVGYALTYLVGMLGLLLLVRLLPMVFRIDLPAEARKVSRHMRLPGDPDEVREAVRARWKPWSHVYLVEEGELTAATLAELDLPSRTGCIIDQLKRDQQLLDPAPELRLLAGDRVKVTGPAKSHARIARLLGPLVLEPDLLTSATDFREVFVSNDEVAGRTLRELELSRHYGCFIVGVSRAQIELTPVPDLALERGDVLYAYGTVEGLEKLGDAVGHIEKNVYQTDLLTFAFGIAAGILIGQVNFRIGEVSLGLGLAGGLLLSGILVGFLRTSNPTFGRVPRAAQFIFMELGLMLFMAGIGLEAGAGVAEAVARYGASVMGAGALVLLAPVLAGWMFGLYVLRMNPALLLGALTGALTSTPALGIVNQAAKSGVPALGYAGAYPIANIVLALIGTILVRT